MAPPVPEEIVACYGRLQSGIQVSIRKIREERTLAIRCLWKKRVIEAVKTLGRGWQCTQNHRITEVGTDH